MSRTVMFAAPASGKMVPIAEFHNFWGSAAYVWTNLSRKYYNSDSYWMTHGRVGGEGFWKLLKDPRLSRTELLVFRATCDRVACERKRFRELAELFRDFVRLFPPEDRACSLLRQASILDWLAGDNHGLGWQPEWVGWQQTTLAENLWWIRGKDDEEGRPYEFGRDEPPYGIFCEDDE